jgi:hypothetical protein
MWPRLLTRVPRRVERTVLFGGVHKEHAEFFEIYQPAARQVLDSAVRLHIADLPGRCRGRLRVPRHGPATVTGRCGGIWGRRGSVGPCHCPGRRARPAVDPLAPNVDRGDRGQGGPVYRTGAPANRGIVAYTTPSALRMALERRLQIRSDETGIGLDRLRRRVPLECPAGVHCCPPGGRRAGQSGMAASVMNSLARWPSGSTVSNRSG